MFAISGKAAIGTPFIVEKSTTAGRKPRGGNAWRVLHGLSARADGTITGRVDLVCESEQVAIAHTQRLGLDGIVELLASAIRIAEFHPHHRLY